jgi:hypothetical protein
MRDTPAHIKDCLDCETEDVGPRRLDRVVEFEGPLSPEQHVRLTHTPLRLSRMGIKVEDASMGPVNELRLTELAIGDDFQAAIAIVCCPRGEMPPKEDLVAKAERYL